MPTNSIVSKWLNLPSVKFNRVVNHHDFTEIYLLRNSPGFTPLDSKHLMGFTCSCCGQMSFLSWDCRELKIRDLSVFELKTYLVLYKHRTNCSICGVKTERLDFVDPYSRCTIRFEELVARLCCMASLKQVARLLIVGLENS